MDKGARGQGDREQGHNGIRVQDQDKGTSGKGSKGTRDKGTRGQGDKGTRGQGDNRTR